MHLGKTTKNYEHNLLCPYFTMAYKHLTGEFNSAKESKFST